MSNEEYLEMLEQQNQSRKAREMGSKEYQERKKLEEREKGFNVYMQGANQRQQQPISVGQKGREQRGARRQWRDPSKSNERASLSRSPINVLGNQKQEQAYYNPFDLKQQSFGDKTNPDALVNAFSNFNKRDKSPPTSSPSLNAPAAGRKKWGNKEAREQIEVPVEDDDDYSDDDFEQIDNKTLQVIKESTNELDASVIQEIDHNNSSAHIEQFLKTATAQEMDIIRESLSGFQDVSKNFSNLASGRKKDNDDDYIEEEFEEDIPEDNDENNSSDEKEELKFEVIKKSQQSTHKGRPVSAVYDLSQFKTDNKSSQRTLNAAPSQKVLSQNQMQQMQYVPSTVKKDVSSKYSQGASAMKHESAHFQTEQGFQTNRVDASKTAFGHLQPNKPSLTSNPFKRPFSETNQKRKGPKTFHQTDIAKLQAFSTKPDVKFDTQNQLTTRDDIEQSYQSVVSKKDQELSYLMQIISHLDDSQRQDLMKVLESKKPVSSQYGSSMAGGYPQFQSTASMKVPEILVSSASSVIRARNEMRIKVLSTHGDPHLCGLTEIEMFDKQAKKIVILPTNISIKNSSGAQMATKSLVNGEKLTNEHRNMWIGRLPLPQNPPIHLEIIVYYALNIEISAVKIWNYNKSMRDGTKGVRDIELYLNDEVKYLGPIKMARGSKTVDYSQLITFQDGVNIKDEIQPIIEAKNEETIDHSNVSFSQAQPAIFKQDVSDYRSDYVEKQSEQSQYRPRNIDVIRQRNKNEMSKSRSRSPIDAGKPVWLQPKDSQLLKNPSSRSFVGNTSKSPNYKLNRRQTEQLEQKETPVNIHNKFKTIFGEDDESIQWPSKIEAKKTESIDESIQWPSKKSNIADDIFKAVNVVNQVVRNSESVMKERSAVAKDSENIIAESLDSMDFFKVTNLGRINEVGPQSQQRQTKQRSKWGQKPAIEEKKEPSETIASDTSNISGKEYSQKSVRRGPKIMKSTFPEEFCLPSPATSVKKSISAVSRQSNKKVDKINEEDDLLKDVEINVIKTKPRQLKSSLDDSVFESELKEFESQNPSVIHNDKTQDEILIDKLHIFKQPFMIPSLPMGRTIEFNILQTWGDINYLGMTGIEMFDSDGKKIEASEITANPSDINLLMGQGTDPRTVDKLLDGTNFTNDDFHAWLTPFTKGEDHTITIKLQEKKTISMIRLWNYNKSRIHSFRGARLITCQLDGKMIFKGEISKAPGNTNDPSQCCEIILFTNDEAIMTEIDKNDWINNIEVPDDETNDEFDQQSLNRPMTATKKFSEAEVQQLQQAFKTPTSMFDERPKTKAIRREPLQLHQDHFDLADNEPNYDLDDFKPVIKKKAPTRSGGMKGRVIELNITESWGDLFYVGLNGIEIYDVNQEKITISNIDANPRDMNSIPGHGQDHRTLDKLINDVNNTIDDRNMWLIPYNVGEDHKITINLGRIVQIGAIKFYNYNKSLEDTLRGVRQISIKVDGKLATTAKGITLRKAPGYILPYDQNMCNDIGQTIYLPFADGWKTNLILPIQRQSKGISSILQEFETINMPIGFNVRINLYSTHGDNYYIGLNGLELFDQLGNIIPVNAQEQVMVNPSGINRIPGMDSDVRTIDKLFNGNNDTYNDQNMWLAPFKFTRSHAAANSSEQDSDKREPNFISVVFDKPIALGAVRLWNYAKTSTRGAHEFEILVDDKPVYRGFAKAAPESEQAWQKSMQRDFSTVVIFSQEMSERFKNQIQFDPTKEQDVLMFNERKQMNQVQQRPNEKFVFNEQDRPQTKYGKF